eukprot:CAMPEP_0174927894 /NCGR_PEP_ID=MMETSP1355-20121228/21990_1 /TAXON_ID=464990 /ORGANISM="Hemiselmis tepida, Strain CCMP443" /LENGTH=52 /DNA_ID=CAMNT_0016174027 /DNA_START=385 /DNA_END=543 /DNA_ORIENTATION=-
MKDPELRIDMQELTLRIENALLQLNKLQMALTEKRAKIPVTQNAENMLLWQL